MKARIPHSRRRRGLLLLAAASLVEPLALRARGFPVGGNLIVRCRCPVGGHRSLARSRHDVRLP